MRQVLWKRNLVNLERERGFSLFYELMADNPQFSFHLCFQAESTERKAQYCWKNSYKYRFLFAFAASHFIMGFQLVGETVQSFNQFTSNQTHFTQSKDTDMPFICLCLWMLLPSKWNTFHTIYMCMYVHIHLLNIYLKIHTYFIYNGI